MAKLTFEIPKELEEQFRKAENIHEIALKMVDAAAEIFIRAIKNRLEPHRDTGALIDSTSVLERSATASGASATIGFSGSDEKGTENDIKANVLEYGTSSRKAHPFLTKAKNDAQAEAAAVMQKILDDEIGGE